MLHALRYNVTSAPKIIMTQNIQVRSFWEYVNMMFNKPDADRLKQFGPDRACAEWVLRNGGKVVLDNGKKLANYNLLPPEKVSVNKVVEIDDGCTMLQKMILHNNKYIDDRAMKGLSYGRSTLSYVQVSKCINVTDNGLKELTILDKLETLVLYSLESVSNLEECKQYLQERLPKCKIRDGDSELKESSTKHI